MPIADFNGGAYHVGSRRIIDFPKTESDGGGGRQHGGFSAGNLFAGGCLRDGRIVVEWRLTRGRTLGYGLDY